ncbi:3434_t:CDS:2 [Entrophospora sp. SA101]|nr:3434_t:CDS:2 [Entrophospora sp. SA101]
MACLIALKMDQQNGVSRREQSLSPRSAGYREMSSSPKRRRSPSPRHNRTSGREDRYRDDRYTRDSRYSRDNRDSRDSRGYYGRSSYRDDRGYRDYPYPYERRAPPRRTKPIDRGSDKERSDTTTLYVGNIPYTFREHDVADMFERYGRLRKVTVQLDNYTGRNKGFAFVEFEDRKDAEDAYDKYHGANIEGRRLKLDWDIGLSRKDQHRKEKPGYAEHGRPPYDSSSPPEVRELSPNYRSGARSPSPYSRQY